MIILGPLADVAREKLIRDHPDWFELPRTFYSAVSVVPMYTIIGLFDLRYLYAVKSWCYYNYGNMK